MEVIIRNQFSTEIKEITLINKDSLGKFLRNKPVEEHCIVRSNDLTCIDVDTHGKDPFTTEVVNILVGVLPDQLKPDFYFKSHNGGIKLIYVGRDHRSKALFGSLYMPKNISGIEIKQDFRHPLSKHHDSKGVCSEVFSFDLETEPFRPYFHLNGWFDESDVKEYLKDKGLIVNQHYGHSKCPIMASDNENSAVSVMDHGIFCHSCSSNGYSLKGSNKDGWVPYSLLTQEKPLELLNLASLNIHWAHARLILMDGYKFIPEKLLKEMYRYLILDKFHKEDAPTFSYINDFFDSDLAIVFSNEGLIRDNVKFEVYKEIKVLSKYIPYCRNYFLREDPNGKKEPKWKSSINQQRTCNVISGILKQFKKVKTYKGLDLDQNIDADFVKVRIKTNTTYPVNLLEEPMDFDLAFGLLSKSFPDINAKALQLVIGATICSSVKTLPPNMLFITGPSGSGKGETVNIGASFLEQTALKVNYELEPEKFSRSIGSLISDGNCMACLDELGKIHFRRVNDFITKILQLSSKANYRPLFSTRDILLESKISLFFPTTTIPEDFYNSPEFRRRVWVFKLFDVVPDWKQSCGGDSYGWREQSSHNAFVANSIVTHVYKLASQYDFNFDQMADALGGCRLGNDSDKKEADLVGLYKYVCGKGEVAPSQILNSTFTKEGKWVDLKNEHARVFIESILTNPDDTDRSYIWHNLKRDLCSMPVTTILKDAGIIEPGLSIELNVKVHGKSVGFRFMHKTGNLKGRWLLNENIPHSFDEVDSIDTDPKPAVVNNNLAIAESVFGTQKNIVGGSADVSDN